MAARILSALLMVCFAASCGLIKRHSETPPESTDRLFELKQLYEERLSQAAAMRDTETGWLARWDCDAMIWSGQYASATGVSGVDILAAEFDGSGRFSRRPMPPCWDGSDQGSKTTWSRDMYLAGLLPWAWYTSQREVLERHARYGKENNWIMGEPLDDGRVVYTPSLIGITFKAIEALGGEHDVNSIWPDVYPSGLVDYEAHLQAMSILLHGEIAAKMDGSALTLDISNTMFERIIEHANNVPEEPLYAFLAAKYDGKMTHVLDLLLDPSMPMGGFVRCSEPSQCRLAHWLFVASLTIRWMEAERG